MLLKENILQLISQLELDIFEKEVKIEELRGDIQDDKGIIEGLRELLDGKA